MAGSHDPTVRDLIVRTAIKYNIDPRAALAVAMGEGGIRWGAVGDNGTSFGPFQLRRGGALPQGKDAAWANSPAGIDYAIRKMAEYGAAGLTGVKAIDAIVRKFERPYDPDASVQNAVARLQGNQIPWDGKAPTAQTLPATSSTVPGTTLPAVAGSPVTASPLASPLMQAASPLGILNSLSTGKKWNPLDTLSGLAQIKAMPKVEMPAMPTSPGAPSPSYDPASYQPIKGLVSPLPTPWSGSSEFGMVDAEGAPGADGKRYHSAKDWFAPAGTTVVAPITGRIVEVKASRGNSGQVFGGVVKVQAENGQVFVFRHVDPLKLKLGGTIQAGSPIATISAWKSGSPHAHIEIWRTLEGGYVHENMIDPATYFAGGS